MVKKYYSYCLISRFARRARVEIVSNLKGKAVYVVDGNRTPFLKARGVGPFSGADLATAAATPLLNRHSFAPNQFDQIIIGTVMPGPDEANLARIVSLRIGCGEKVPAFTVMRNCASGMQALDSAALEIASGRSHLILAGGTDAMSRAPILFNPRMVGWLSQWYAAKQVSQRMKLLLQLRPSYLSPVIALLRGLTDPLLGLTMGQTAEEVAYHFHITRNQMDAFAFESHQRTLKAYASHTMEEVTPIIDREGRLYEHDNGVRAQGTVEDLSRLKPFFDKKFGLITAGNSSQVSDGACLLILASEEAVEKYNLPVLGQIVDSQWAALSPVHMGLGPVHAVAPILQRHHLDTQAFDCWEINEAFAAQVLGCLAAMDSEEYSRLHLGLDKPLGSPKLTHLNKDGGAIAIGHPVGASGARIVLHVLQSLKQTQGKRGMAAICIGGGQGGAMYLERMG